MPSISELSVESRFEAPAAAHGVTWLRRGDDFGLPLIGPLVPSRLWDEPADEPEDDWTHWSKDDPR
jgi:hypothetical protein